MGGSGNSVSTGVPELGDGESQHWPESKSAVLYLDVRPTLTRHPYCSWRKLVNNTWTALGPFFFSSPQCVCLFLFLKVSSEHKKKVVCL